MRGFSSDIDVTKQGKAFAENIELAGALKKLASKP